MKKPLIFLIIFLIIISILFLINFLNKDNNDGKELISKCYVGGCSGTLCLSEEDNNNSFTTCEWKEEYECYNKAVCEIQNDGKCGFSLTDEFNKCIDDLSTR